MFLVSLFFIAGAVYASTTIGTDINTAGDLTVTGNAQLGDIPTTQDGFGASYDISLGRNVTNPIANTGSVGYSEIEISPSFVQSVNESSGYSGYVGGLNVTPAMTGGGNISGLVGIHISPTYSGIGTFTDNINSVESNPVITSGTIPTVRGLNTYGNMTGGTVTNWMGLGVDDFSGIGQATNNFGVNVSNLSHGASNYSIYTNQSAGANNYAIYNAGSAKSLFTGNIIANSTLNKGIVTLSAGTGTATVASGSVCVVSETTDETKTVKGAVSGTTLTITGTGTDAIAYICL